MLMPTLQSADLLAGSGRYDAYGPEMLRIRDRQDREMVYGPTNEEMMTAIFRDRVKSYRDLPRTLYHIQWKFRDEVRPRFGVMRGREFLMKDAYSFDLDEAGARQSYNTQMLRLSEDIPANGNPGGADEGDIRPDRWRPQPRVHRSRTDRRERSLLRRGYEEFDWRQADVEYGDEAGLQGLVRPRDVGPMRRPKRHATRSRNGSVPEASRGTGAASRSATSSTSATNIPAAMGLKVSRPRRHAGHADDGQLWHRRVAAGRRDHRGEPRRCRDHLARGRLRHGGSGS